MLVEIEQTKGPMMDVLRQFSRTQGMQGLADLLEAIQDGSKTGKLSGEFVRTVCMLAAIEFTEAVQALRAEGVLSLDLPHVRSVKRKPL